MKNLAKTMLLVSVVATLGLTPAQSAPASQAAAHPNAPEKPCSSVDDDTTAFLTLGKSQIVRLNQGVVRILVSGRTSSHAGKPAPVPTGAPMNAPPQNPSTEADSMGVADTAITLLSPTELLFEGKSPGTMNVVLQGMDGRCLVKNIVVTIDPDAVKGKLQELIPEEAGVTVRAADNAFILAGEVSSAMAVDEVMNIARAYGDGKKVVNLMHVAAPQQVMLEVKIAEVSKTLLDKLGSSLGISRSANVGPNTYSLNTGFLTGSNGLLNFLRAGRTSISLDAEKDDGLVRVLSEPNIMAVSGQQASFLSGGRIFIPVLQPGGTGQGATVTLEEKEFGVGIKFIPTVLAGARINLKMVSEVSELSQTGTPFVTTGGVTNVIPSMTVRRADTTVQLNDGQSFAIAGLIKNNVNQSINRLPVLGEVPVLGALFRSNEFQTDQTELLFTVTPRLVKPLDHSPTLPTDNHVVPSRSDVMLNGALEGAQPAPATDAVNGNKP